MAGLQGVTGAVVALDPATGAILGMASTPTYDPNQLSSHDPDAIRAYAEQLEARDPDPPPQPGDPGELPARLDLQGHRLRRGPARTGSPRRASIPAPDEFPLPNSSRVIPNFNGSACSPSGEQPLIDALTISCNTAFAQLGLQLGEDRVREKAEAFGLDGEEREIPLPVADSHVGDIVDDAALAQTSIGQRDVRVTPLQAAMIAAGVANGGSIMAPYLVDQVRAPDLSVRRPDRSRGVPPGGLRGGRRPADRDDDQRRRQRQRPPGPDRRRPGRREDRHRADRPAPRTTTGSSASRPPTTRRSPSLSSSPTAGVPVGTCPRRSPVT